MAALRRKRPLGRSSMRNSSKCRVDHEEALDVEHARDETLLEQDFARSQVAGFAHAVSLALGQLALDNRSSSELAARRWSELFGSCCLQTGFVEVEGDGPTIRARGAAFAQGTGAADIGAEVQHEDRP